ncbi:hypothetical protein LCGC14_1793500 [marine sediment metagenome]|uniref:Uncharacterized protein n=1 Tax=marine sediment metagenome TaxID=412755 RepID=A0A0F9HEG0_9ZZZZ
MAKYTPIDTESALEIWEAKLLDVRLNDRQRDRCKKQIKMIKKRLKSQDTQEVRG